MAIEKAKIDGVENQAEAWGLFNDLIDQIEDSGVLLQSLAWATRDMTTASGDVDVTLTFEPKIIIVFAVVSADNVASWGFDDGSDPVCVAYRYTDLFATDDRAVSLLTASGASQTAIMSAKSSTGYTLTWVKTGSPTGTAYLKIGCLA